MMEERKRMEQVSFSLREAADCQRLAVEECARDIVRAGACIVDCLRQGGKLLLFGNGGSAANAQHLAAEFVGRFSHDRRPLPAIALTTDTSVLTAVGNDFGFDHVFSRQVRALGIPGDVVLAISTSGNSPNVVAGVTAARECALRSIALTGGGGGELAKWADIAIVVPSNVTTRIQECQLVISHILCEIVEVSLDASTA